MLIRILAFLPLLWASNVTASDDDEATSRINGGVDAPLARYAYMVSLQSTSTLSHFCGGTLIAPDVVLTAAHCLEDKFVDGIAVRVQPHRLNDPVETSEIFPALQMVLHPAYDTEFIQNDVALIKLNGTATNQPLPTVNSDPGLPFIGQILTQMGWGDTTEELNVLPAVLQVLENSTYIGVPTCREQVLEFTNVPPGFVDEIVNDLVICTLEGDGEGVCFGDSGGPLIVPGTTPEEDIQVGVTSFLFDCSTGELPSGFTRLSSTFDFIRRALCALSSFPPAYFDCSGLPDTNAPSATPVAPTVSPAPSGLHTLVTVRLFLGFNPSGVSWRIETLDGAVLHEVESGTYTDVFEFVSTTVSVPSDKILNFVVVDELGFGLLTSSSNSEDAANVFLGDRPDVMRLLAKVRPSLFGFMVTTSFTSSEEGIIPTTATNFPTVAPSLSMSPTQVPQVPNGTSVNVTLVIDFDTYPVDTSWIIRPNSFNEIIASGGPYSPFVGDSVTETIPLIANETYLFAVFDDAGNGLCCANGQGEIFIYLGNEPNVDQVLVYDDGRFSFVNVHFFTTSLNETFAYSQAPSASPSLSQSPSVVRVLVDPFPVTVRIQLDSYPFETSWVILDDEDNTVYERGPIETSQARFVHDTIELEHGHNYTFVLYDSFGDGILDGGYGVVTAGAEFDQGQALAAVLGNFTEVGNATFTASLDDIFVFNGPPEADFTPFPSAGIVNTNTPEADFTPFPSAGIVNTNTPSLSPSTTGVPTSSAQTNITIELDFLGFSYDTFSFSIDRTDTGRTVFFKNDFDFFVVFEGWNEIISLDLGREYLFTVADRSGFGAVDSFVYFGSEADISQTLMAMQGSFGYVRKQFFVASEEGLLGFTASPTSVPTISPSLRPSFSSSPSFTPSVSLSPTVSPAPSGSDVSVLVLIQFDGFPGELGWRIVDSGGTVIIDIPTFTYTFGTEFATETVVLQNEGEYVISFIDDFLGLCCLFGEGNAFVFLGTEPDGRSVLVYEDGTFDGSSNHTFIVSADYVLPTSELPLIPRLPTQPPTNSVSPSMPPTVTGNPSFSPAPTRSVTDVLVMIQLDEFPSETTWQLLHPNGTIVAEALPFSYSGMSFEVVTEVVSLQSGLEYTFTLQDLFGDGICCLYGGGSAFVFLGTQPDPDSILVYDDGQFARSRSHTFVASEDGVLTLSPLPDIPELPTPTTPAPTPNTTPSVVLSPVGLTPTVSTMPVTPAPVTPLPTVEVTPAPVTEAPVETATTAPVAPELDSKKSKKDNKDKGKEKGMKKEGEDRKDKKKKKMKSKNEGKK